MAILSTNSPSGAAIRAGRQTLAAVKAVTAVKALAGVLVPAQADLKAKMAARTLCDDANIDAQGEAGAREDDLLDALGSLGRKAYGLYESYGAAGYRRIFGIAPSKLAGLRDMDRRAAYAACLEALQDDTPKELAATAKAVVAAHGGYETARTAAAATQKALDKAQEAEVASLDQWHTAVRKLKAQLTDHYPRDRKHVARFFRSTMGKKKPAVAAPVPAPT